MNLANVAILMFVVAFSSKKVNKTKKT